MVLGVVWLAGMGRLAGYKANWQKVLPDKTILDSIHKEAGDLKKKFLMISDMTTKKSVQWAPKFNVISDVLPRGVWIRKMVLDKGSLTMEGLSLIHILTIRAAWRRCRGITIGLAIWIGRTSHLIG